MAKSLHTIHTSEYFFQASLYTCGVLLGTCRCIVITSEDIIIWTCDAVHCWLNSVECIGVKSGRMRIKVHKWCQSSAPASIDLSKDAVKCPSQSPLSLSDALCSISLVQPLSPLPCSSWLRRLDPWSMIYSTIYALSLQHKTLFNCIINFTSTALSFP